MIPNALKGLVQGTDKTQRDLYTSDTAIGTAVDAFKAAIPGLRQTLPEKTDSFGNVMRNENGLLNFLNNNLLPGTVQRYKDDDVVRFLRDVSEATGKSNFYPARNAPESITEDDEIYKLSQRQRTAYKKAYGEAYADAVELILEAVGDNEKESANLLSKAKTYANAVAKQDFLDSKGVDYELTGTASNMLKAIEATKHGIDIDIWFKVSEFKNDAKSDEGKNGKTAQEKVIDYIDSVKASDEEKDYLYLAYYNKDSTEKNKKKALKKLPWNRD
jgi:hypothetical protein